MAFLTASRRVFGGKPATANGTQADDLNTNTVNQLQAESITATTGRMIKGPRANGHYSAHVIVGTGTSPVGTLDVWYSNLPDPDPTNDAHWVKDSSVTDIDLSAAATKMINVGNVNCEWVRFKVTRTSGTLSLILFARAEGVEPR